MTARSGTASSSSSVATASIPPTTSAVGCTTLTRPANDSREVGEDAPARRRRVALGADDDDVRRLEDRAQRPHGGLPVAQVGVVLQQVVGGQVELDAHDAVLEPLPVHQPDGAEHAQHGRVPGQRLGDEAAEPGCPGDQRQVLQQHRGDALVVVGVGDGEGDLGLVPAGPAWYSPTPMSAPSDSATSVTCRRTSCTVARSSSSSGMNRRRLKNRRYVDVSSSCS